MEEETYTESMLNSMLYSIIAEFLEQRPSSIPCSTPHRHLGG